MEHHDPRNQTFGMLTVIERGRTESGEAGWRCACECGGEIVVRLSSLRLGRTKSCRCLERASRHRRRLNLNGRQFGRLTAIQQARTATGFPGWLCECDCGNRTVIRTSALHKGRVRSCGCLRREDLIERSTTHGALVGQSARAPRLYRIWGGMRQRCGDANSSSYGRYGALGVRVCSEWSDFAAFHAWAMANGYRDDLTIDRIDSIGNYEPSNCRWATAVEQGNNTRRNRLVTFQGETRTVAEWAKVAGINYAALYGRLVDLGWSIGEALNRQERP